MEIEFLPLQLFTESEQEKTPVVDVRCIDSTQRHFIVEIQLFAQEAFLQRTLFYISRVYGRQLVRGEGYGILEPVYLISLLNFNLFPDQQEGYLSFQMRCDQCHTLAIEGLHLTFVELQKLKKSTNFIPATLKELWTLFLTEYNQLLTMKTNLIPDYPNLLKALDMLDESRFTPEQLAAYDRYQDNLRNMNSVLISNYKKGLGEGMMQERACTLSIITALHKGVLTIEEIALEHQVTVEFVLQLKGI